ncbi:hypothetical protein EYF80_031135 [Liparis tanakae]|uniref:Uncharacterized protein n=1 Tax=Liparis tanakae TaxID=230148 RepID=A0A4Z2H162_9TELE|nr:hypothetical protein EYF80_031135 [Liparis tanakae]
MPTPSHPGMERQEVGSGEAGNRPERRKLKPGRRPPPPCPLLVSTGLGNPRQSSPDSHGNYPASNLHTISKIQREQHKHQGHAQPGGRDHGKEAANITTGQLNNPEWEPFGLQNESTGVFPEKPTDQTAIVRLCADVFLVSGLATAPSRVERYTVTSPLKVVTDDLQTEPQP